jgi:cell wall-associated NlpC family hydrolase
VRIRSTVMSAALLTGLALPVLAPPAPAAAAPTLQQQALAEVQKHAGKSYQWGAAGPTRFDCSGLTMYVYSRLGRSLPHNSKAQSTARGVTLIPNMQKRPGDLIFGWRDGAIRHVGIYAGGSDMYASVQSGDVVRKQSFHGRKYQVGRVS